MFRIVSKTQPNQSLKSQGDPFGTDGKYGVLFAARK